MKMEEFPNNTEQNNNKIQQILDVIENDTSLTRDDLFKIKSAISLRLGRPANEIKRDTKDRKIIGDYEYFRQVSDYGKWHWYMRNTTNGSGKIYYGSENPTFNPEGDLNYIKNRKKGK
jgi:hypothetical protein